MGGVRLGLIVSGLWLSLFLCALETTIVSTSLVHISNDLEEFGDSGWIVVAYLLTYNAFILIWSKLSDTFGTKWLLLLANAIFCVFSIACAVAQTMLQLIVFRALQGVGGSGLYSLVFVILAQIVPMDKLGMCTGILSSCFALASLLGPILGGVISDNTTWRWIFWLNVPGAAVAVLILYIFMESPKSSQEIRRSLKTMDVLGALLSLAWAIPLIFALQEGGRTYPWNGGVIIGTLVAGIGMLLVFAAWQVWTYRRGTIDSLLPVGLFKRPKVALVFGSILLLGFNFYVSIIQIPQRFQFVNYETATRAGILLLPATLASPVMSVVAGALANKHRLSAPAIHLVGACLNMVGVTLMSTLSVGISVPNAQFGYQVIMGTGFGFVMPSLMYLIKVEVEDRDLAGAMGVTNMGRTLGGCIGLAIGGSLFRDRLDQDLPKLLDEGQLEALMTNSAQVVSGLSMAQRERLSEIFGEAFNLQFRGMIAFAALSVCLAGWMLYLYLRRTRGGQDVDAAPEAATAES
ncbi:Vacuolar basic amino acid transporter 5 [Madurella fahalii]|uniref:Vacuolar basic amino acid transporter 5 n=1 Tax=Madurella fahalii TaxID=1157608 RepID=A0ABQ0GPQ4_9PEZI